MIKNILLVGLGGFLGSTFRYLTYLYVDKRLPGVFPLSTLLVNVLGSLILGMLVALILKGSLSESMRLLLAVGLCGSFTTFSTFAMENINLLSQREMAVSFAYVSVSIILGLGSAWFGQWLLK